MCRILEMSCLNKNIAANPNRVFCTIWGVAGLNLSLVCDIIFHRSAFSSIGWKHESIHPDTIWLYKMTLMGVHSTPRECINRYWFYHQFNFSQSCMVIVHGDGRLPESFIKSKFYASQVKNVQVTELPLVQFKKSKGYRGVFNTIFTNNRRRNNRDGEIIMYG